MIYVKNPSLDPYFNHGFEEYLLSLDTDEELFCLWRNGPAVVSGRFQNVFAETDVPEARDRGIAVIRRISGGGTVYHDGGNVNYTVIRSRDENGLDQGAFTAPVAAALRGLGVPAEENGSEIAVKGKKISGGAETAKGKRVLHHGTLLFSADLTALRDLASGAGGAFSSKAIRSNPSPVANLSDFLDSGMTVTEFADELGRLYSGGASPVLPEVFDLTEARLLSEKYASWEWTFGSSPDFAFRGEKETERGILRLSYRSKRGVIVEAECGGPHGRELESVLPGARLDQASLRSAIYAATADGPFADGAARFILNGK